MIITHRLALGIFVSMCAAAGGMVFTAVSANAVSLPDGRVFELVSPAPFGHEANINVPEWAEVEVSGFYEHGVPSEHPFEVASGGEAVVYPGDPPAIGGNSSSGFYGGGNQYLATRSAAGRWTQTDIQPPGKENAFYSAFTESLSVGILQSTEPLVAGLQGEYLVPYAHAIGGGVEGEYSPLVPVTPPNRTPKYPGRFEASYAGANSGTSTVPASSDTLFEANDALPVSGLPQAEDGGPEGQNLYDNVDGKLYLINVLPDGKTEANASFGSPVAKEVGGKSLDLSHVVSADGSLIFWTDINSGNIYMREDDASPAARTVQVDASVGGGGRFWTASSDGSKVFFTKHDLYEYDTSTAQTTDLTPGVEVLGVLGASEDGEYIYYVDSSYRLNLWHDGVSTLIATLSSGDGEGVTPFGAFQKVGDWQAEVGRRTAEVTPDGHSLIFMSSNSLTGYDNEEDGEHLDEVFLYEAGAGKLTCVSCNPSGAPPVPTKFNTYRETQRSLGGFLPVSFLDSYQSRLISNDGSRVFFQSDEPLVPQDTNGWLNVYEWERYGTGSCRESQGCIYLLSGGTDPESSYLVAASASGDDVFFVSRAQLVSQDQSDDDLVYDARVGGVQPPTEPECSGGGCQGVPPAAPVFATPPSVTFNGVGNFPPPVKTQIKPKAPALTAAQRLAKALQVCRAMRNAKKRSACKTRARKRYRPKSKAEKSDGRGK